MKKKSKTFLIILSLFVCLLASCGVPNYFGGLNKFVTTFSSHYLEISDRVLSDGFNPRDIDPKLMFLYTIHSTKPIKQENVSASEISSRSVTDNLKSQFIKSHKPTDIDVKSCPYTSGTPVVTAKIKDYDNNEYEYGLYQLQTIADHKNPDNKNIPENHSKDYLFNKESMAFQYNTRYSFVYELERVGEGNELVLVISCLDEDKNIVASYSMGNHLSDNFIGKFNNESDLKSEDYDYAGTNTQIYILPVLYLESNVYNNKQMMVADWVKLDLKLPEELELPEIGALQDNKQKI